MIKYYNIKQKSDEWLLLRKGKFTASHAQAIGNAGAGLDSLCVEIMCDATAIKSDAYTNEDMERGNALEESARNAYIEFSEHDVREIGFVENNAYPNAGCSPDGLVGEDGLIEIKCPNNLNFFKLILEPKIKPEYMWQIQMQLLITGREWCDYVCYNENFEKKLVVIRVLPDAEMQKKIADGIIVGNNKLTELNEKIKAI